MLKSLKNNKLLTSLVATCILVVFYLLDRITKLVFLTAPEVAQDFFDFLPFGLELYKNQNVVFGINMPVSIIAIISTLLLIIVIWYLLKSGQEKKLGQVFLWGLILIGGFSNLWDRFFYGYVIDWWQMPWQAVINLADIYIFAGVILLIITFSKKK